MFVFNVCFHDYEFLNNEIIIIGFKNSKIETSLRERTAINFTNSKCIISSLYIDANKSGNALCAAFSQMHIYDCLFSGTSKSSGASICCFNARLKMRNTKIDECIEAGIIASGNAHIDIKNCEVYKTGQKKGSGIEIREGSSGTIDSTLINECKQGLLIWMNPGNVTVENCVISNCLSEGIYVEKQSNQSLSFPNSSLVKQPEHQLTKIIGNKIINNCTFGVTTDNFANVILLNNEIASNGCAGVIIKGNANNTMKGNFIHSNKMSGIEIGMNFDGNILIQENILKNNKKKAISSVYDLPLAKVSKKPIIGKNTIEDTFAENFCNFKISANRPSTRMSCFTNFQYTCGNTFARNLLSEFDTTGHFDVYLGGFCDIRHLLETIYQSREKPIEIEFHLNDINITVIARCVMLLYAIQKLNDKIDTAFDLMMLWVSPKIYKHQKTL